jgi:subtilase family serine protease
MVNKKTICRSFGEIEDKIHNNSIREWEEDLYSLVDKYNIDMKMLPENEQYIRKIFREEFERYKQELAPCQLMTDSDAKEAVFNLLKFFKKEGKDRIDILELSVLLKLPLKQVANILNQLETDGFVKGEE